MVMGRVGKVRSFKISPAVLLWFALFLLVYLPVSVFVVNRWVDLRREAKKQEVEIERLELALASSERSLFKFKQHVTLLEGYITSLELEERQPAVEKAEEAGERGQEDLEESQVEAGTPQPEPGGNLVGIERMAMERKGNTLEVNFNLVNVTEGEEPVSGYVHILATGEEHGSSWWETYPRGEVSEGFPKSYRVGQPFIIQRFKPIRGRFDIRSGRGGPESIRVVVYGDSGRLIYHQDFEVKNAS